MGFSIFPSRLAALLHSSERQTVGAFRAGCSEFFFAAGFWTFVTAVLLLWFALRILSVLWILCLACRPSLSRAWRWFTTDRVCSWCGGRLHTSLFPIHRTTHGICPACFARAARGEPPVGTIALLLTWSNQLHRL